MILRGAADKDTPVEMLPDALRALRTVETPWLTCHVGRAEQSFTGGEVWSRSLRWAEALRLAGVESEDRVLILQPNGVEFVGALFGAMLLGAVPVPAAWPVFFSDQLRTRRAIQPLLETSRPSALAIDERLADYDWPVRVVSGPAKESMPERELGADSSAPAFIQFTSGSTSRPRGAVISHRAAYTSARLMADRIGLTSSDVCVSWLPLFHDMGLVGTLLCSVLARSRLHLMTPAEFLLRPRRWLELITRVRATITVGPNFAYDLVTRRSRDLDGLDLSSLRVALNGSEPIHRTTIEAFDERFAQVGFDPRAMWPAYGLAENTLGVSFADTRREDLDWQGRRVPSVGTPLAGIDISIHNAVGGTARDGQEGEIFVRGPTTMTGYFDDADATERALSDGWIRTGDLGVLRGGQLYITGREKELIIKGGQKFHPYDIERVVAASIESSLNSVAAFSATCGLGTEELHLAVEMRGAAPERVERIIRGRVLEEVGVRIDRIRVVSPGTLPRTTSGKLQRASCAALFEERPCER